jgi:hypothetical protein
VLGLDTFNDIARHVRSSPDAHRWIGGSLRRQCLLGSPADQSQFELGERGHDVGDHLSCRRACVDAEIEGHEGPTFAGGAIHQSGEIDERLREAEPARVLYVVTPSYVFEPGPAGEPPAYDDAVPMCKTTSSPLPDSGAQVRSSPDRYRRETLVCC